MNLTGARKGILLFCLMVFALFMSKPCLAAISPQIEFTPEERAYLSKKKSLRVAVCPLWRPYCYLSGDPDAPFAGYALDLLARVCKETGLRLELLPTDTYEKTVALCESGQADLSAMQVRTEKPTGTDAAMIGYLTAPILLICHKDASISNLRYLSLAEAAGVSFLNVEKYRPHFIEIAPYATIDGCLDALRAQRADLFACDEYTASALTDFLITRDLVTKNIVEHEVTIGFGLAKGADPMLTPILSKVLSSMSTSERNRALFHHNAATSAGEALLMFIYRHPLELLCAILALSFVAAICLLTYTRVRIRQHRVLAGYEDAYRMLADTFGEMGLEYEYLPDRLTVFGRKRTLLDMPEVVEDFRATLQEGGLRIAMSVQAFDQLADRATPGRSYEAEFQFGLREGALNWYRMLYIVVFTEESHRRPIRLIGSLTNIDEEYQQRRLLQEMGQSDALTGLLNRRAGEALIEGQLKEDCESDILLLIDLDYFKRLNDRFGHLCGDEALRALSAAARDAFGSEAILCRWGGDEFLFYLKGVAKSGALPDDLARLRSRMKGFAYKGQILPIALSIGGVQVRPGTPLQELFSRADEALYKVKNNGRGDFFLQ